MNQDDAAELRRLRWHCRRGMLELDHLLLGFLERGYTALMAEDRTLFKRLLLCQDQDLSDWLMSRRAPSDRELRRMVQHVVAVAGASGSEQAPQTEIMSQTSKQPHNAHEHQPIPSA